MLRVPVRLRCADADGLRDIIDALKHQIEPPRADAPRCEIDHQFLAKKSQDSLQIFWTSDRLRKFERHARHLARDDRYEHFSRRAQRLVEAQQHI